jgi:adenylate kinase family enzyme
LPGVGKTTQSEIIAEKYCMCNWACGKIKRNAWRKGDSEMGKYLQRTYKNINDWRGVEDFTLMAFLMKDLMEMINSPKCTNGILMDYLPESRSL